MSKENLLNLATLYEERIEAAAQLRKEIKQLKQALTPLLKAEPEGTIIRGNGKLKVVEVKTRGPVNRKHLETSLISLIINSKSMEIEQATMFSRAAVLHVWNSRPYTMSTQVQRTFSKRKKCEDVLVGMQQDTSEEDDAE